MDRRISTERDPAPGGLAATRREAPRRILVIVNPTARRYRPARLERIVVALENCGCTVTVRRTAGPGDGTRLARAAGPEFDLIVAAGGDGTVNEVANGIAAAPRPLAVLPFGTANVLAQELSLPKRPAALAARLAAGRPHPLWPARLDGWLFLSSAGVGFDAEVVGRVDLRLKRWVGKLAFSCAILACLWHYRPRRFAVSIDGKPYRAASLVVAKSRFYAGRFVLAPAARAADPSLHVVLFQRAGRGAALRYLAAMALGLLHRLPDVAIVPGCTVRVESGEPDPVQADGEIAGRLPVTIARADAPLPLIRGD